MAPTRTNSEDDNRHAVPSLEEIIFSCGICQATVSELYPAHENHPASHAADDDDGMGIKLWIGNCVHVFCGRHVEGGGVPFHSSSDPPQAECPVCVRSENNHDVRNLYGIRGLTQDKMDPAIPSIYVKCPPVSLDGNDPGVEALRFQYSRMKCYSQDVSRRWKSADRKRRAMENVLHKERKLHRQLEADYQELQKQKEEAEKKLLGWEGRKGQIKHYMGAVAEMAADIHIMRTELVKIGYNVEKKTYGLDDIPPVRGQQPSVSHPVRGNSSATLVDERYNTSSSKRKRPVEDDLFPENEEIEQDHAQGEASYLTSQPLLPPRQSQPMQPPVPHLQPVSTSQSRHFPSPAKQLQPESQPSRPVQTYESRDWRAFQPRGGVRGHQDSLPAIQSMRLSSPARPRQPLQRFAASPNVRAQIAPQQRYQEPRIEEQQYVRPPPFPPAGMYSRTPAPHRDDGRPQQNDFHLDLAPGEHQPRLLDRHYPHVEDAEMFEGMPKPQPLALPPSANLYERTSNVRDAYPRSEAPTRRQDHDQPASSVISPFFRGSGGPARQYGMLPSSAMISQQSRLAHVGPTAESPTRAYMAPPPTSTIEHGLTRGPLLVSDAQYSSAHSRRPARVQPLSRRLNGGVPQRAVYQSTSGSQLRPHPSTRPVLGRITLGDYAIPVARYSQGTFTLPSAPNSQRGRDPQVYQIRGVRGAGPATLVSNGMPNVARRRPMRGPLYSQAPNRTVVQR